MTALTRQSLNLALLALLTRPILTEARPPTERPDPCGIYSDPTDATVRALTKQMTDIVTIEFTPGNRDMAILQALPLRRTLLKEVGQSCYEQLQRLGLGSSPITGE